MIRTANRKDNKGRALRTGECQLKDGRYRYKYHPVSGVTKYVQSNRLLPSDPISKGKKKQRSLRELEIDILKDLEENTHYYMGEITVYDLVLRYIKTRNNVKPTTEKGYTTVINILKKDIFGKLKIRDVKRSDAKLWIIRLNSQEGKRSSLIHNIRGVLRPAFQMAVDDEYLRINPFDFKLGDVIADDTEKRDALTDDQVHSLLTFIRDTPGLEKFYDPVYILFGTGLRISEFCGLTVADIDFDNHQLRVERQLMKNGSKGYYIQTPKTASGRRVLPMTSDVEDCFRRIVQHRRPPRKEPVIQGIKGFLFFDMYGSVKYALHWEHSFQRIMNNYRKLNEEPFPKVTPHVCRHTYCSNLARKGISIKALQYLMGHSSVSITMDVYTHYTQDDVAKELKRLNNLNIESVGLEVSNDQQ